MNIFDELSEVYRAGLHNHPLFWNTVNKLPVDAVIKHTDFLVGKTRLVGGEDWLTLCNIVSLHRNGFDLTRKQVQRCAMTVIQNWNDISFRCEL